MTRFKAFNRLFLGAFLGMLAAVAGMGFYMQPILGDLTRLGGYLENDYGWNMPQESFPEPLFVLATSLDAYDRHFDVVVLGDSFSEKEERGWQNYLAARTGWSIITFNMNQFPLEEVLATPMYRSSPPALFIYQSVERNVPRRHPACTESGRRQFVHEPPRLPPLQPTGVTPDLKQRDRGPLFVESLDASPIFNFWRKALTRTVLGTDDTEVHRTPNLRPALFSNKDNDHILLITRDLLLQNVKEHDVRTSQCSLLTLQDKIRAGSTTEFAVLVFPDKSSMYSDYLTDEAYRNLSIAADLENTAGLNIAQIWKQFSAEVDRGTIDFYLPNDTHCGDIGYRIAANALLDLLTSTNDHAGPQ